MLLFDLLHFHFVIYFMGRPSFLKSALDQKVAGKMPRNHLCHNDHAQLQTPAR